ncbi:MAG: hypothetical protein HRU11_01270 [Parvularculaceae bacterium]|nr:hypothetical protein [Parvularculaceae bacterium]
MTLTDDKVAGGFDEAQQPLLPFAPRITDPSPYRPSDSQADAGELLDHFVQRMVEARGGLTTLLLSGPEGCGKTRMVEEVLASNPSVDGMCLPIKGIAPLDLFAEINSAAASGGILVLEDRRSPDKWFLHDPTNVPPDLTSRLMAAPRLTLDRPGDSALLRALRADLELHGHRLSHAALKQAAGSLPRTFHAPRAFCRALDATPLGLALPERLELALEKSHAAFSR